MKIEQFAKLLGSITVTQLSCGQKIIESVAKASDQKLVILPDWDGENILEHIRTFDLPTQQLIHRANVISERTQITILTEVEALKHKAKQSAESEDQHKERLLVSIGGVMVIMVSFLIVVYFITLSHQGLEHSGVVINGFIELVRAIFEANQKAP